MKRTLVYANNPKWSNRSCTQIDLTVRFEEINQDLPFTASPNDTEQYGREIYQLAASEVFGKISEFEPRPFSIETVINHIKAQRDFLLEQTDWTQLPDIPQSAKILWEPYRQALRDLPQQEGFPWYQDVLVETDSGCGFEMDLSKVPWPERPSL